MPPWPPARAERGSDGELRTVSTRVGRMPVRTSVVPSFEALDQSKVPKSIALFGGWMGDVIERLWCRLRNWRCIATRNDLAGLALVSAVVAWT